ncbi:MAG: 4Fe-4S binding protein, partial [Deltaproteobacteria bacterium]|nr:4Fe-4S binding protein [Deltaproteobacteria bacterium]
MMDPARSPRVRVWIWRLFSLVFFGQLGLGLLGFETFLMTGEVHLPVPALILAGPAFRGGGLFMIVLFGVTVVLVGPAWCSHLCYIGAWDDAASRLRRKPGRMPAWRRGMHVALLAAVLLAALGMRLAGVPGAAAAAAAGVFGLAGVGIMILWSRRMGVMVHCTAWCPVGVAATWLGRISPFRVAIDEGCTRCG